VTHVINYSLPRELDSYVHRIGRTARSGKTGFALNLVTQSHRGLIGRIEKATKSKMKEGRIPTRKDIAAKKIAQTFNKFEGQKTFARAIELMDPTWKDALAQMSQEEVAGRLLSMMYPEVFNIEREALVEAPAPSQNRTPNRRSRDEYRPRHNDRRESGPKPVSRGVEGGFGGSSGRASSGGFGPKPNSDKKHYGSKLPSKDFAGYDKSKNKKRASDWNRPLSR
jgi:ATP-dependent RNA helicase DeaD